MSPWVLRTMQFGYMLQFALNSADGASVLQQEVSSLLLKGTSSDLNRNFFSQYFLVPKKDGGLCPVLDLCRLNYSLYRVEEIQDADAQDHSFPGPRGRLVHHCRLEGCLLPHSGGSETQEVPQARLRGKVYQYKVLPFGLALAPRTFTKCMDAALAPLRLQWIRILNYLDDWLPVPGSR